MIICKRMDDLIIILILVAACVIAKPNHLEHHDGREPSSIPGFNFKRESISSPESLLKEIGEELNEDQSNLASCEDGEYLEYLKLQCESEKFIKLRNAIDDMEKPPKFKIMAMLASAVAIGCKETALYLSDLLAQRDNKHIYGETKTCISSQTSGPIENEITPCDVKTDQVIRQQLSFSQKLKLMYEITSSPFYLTLGCHSLGKDRVVDLASDLNLNDTNNSTIQNELEKDIHLLNENKDALIMDYVYQHKSDTQNTESILQSMESDTEDEDVDGGNSTNVATRNISKRDKTKRSIDDYFTVKPGCSIVGSTGVLLDSLPKSTCLQYCYNDKSCRSAGYTNDNTQWCQLNTEIEKEVGSFFTCGVGESSKWDYFEKKIEPVYFIITNKLLGDVLEASASTSVQTKPYNENDNQLWVWKEDAIYSKKYPENVLTIKFTDDTGKVVLETNQKTKTQMWNFEDGLVTSQYNNLVLEIKDGELVATQKRTTVVSSIGQKWSMSLGRFYFIITSRQSGKVIEARKEDKSGRRVTLASYHGGETQLWYWEDDCIRSKLFPSKVLYYNITRYYDKDDRDKILLTTFRASIFQKWKMEGDNLVSRVFNLEEKYSKHAKGNVLTGAIKNGKSNQRWTFGTFRTYFFIMNKKTGKVIDAVSKTGIRQWHYHVGQNQIWFWDGNVIRNKKYTDRVIDFNVNGGSLFLNHFTGTKNQEWKYDDKEMKLVSAFNNLTLEVQDGSFSDGAVINAKSSSTQKWSLTPEHDFFTITSRMSVKVLQPTLKRYQDNIIMWSMNGGDNQLWFWDGDNLRNKKLPSKVLSFVDYFYDDRNDYAHVHLRPYKGVNNQRWKIIDDDIVSFYKDLRLSVQYSGTTDGTKVGVKRRNENLSQRWSQNSKERTFFTIKNVKNGKVLEAISISEINLLAFNGNENQQWFWDQDSIRSRQYPMRVLDLHKDDFVQTGFGKIYLQWYNTGKNQRWKLDGKHIISKYRDVYLDAVKSPLPGGQLRDNTDNQRWLLEAAMNRGTRTTSCVDKTEQKIYNVVQFIPFISTLWDLFSSIGYAIAGCNSVAEERAVSMAIGTVMDVASIVSGGTATGITTVLKAGFKVGIRFGMKQGLKATIKVTQQSIKQFIQSATKKIAQTGLLKSIAAGVKKSGKLLIKETLVDPAMFLKNAGKMSKNILTHPIKTFKQTWMAASAKINDLKKLRKAINKIRKQDGNYKPKVLCKRGGALSCTRVVKGYSNSQRKLYDEILTDKLSNDKVKVCANRYMTKNIQYLGDAPKAIQDKIEGLSTNIEKAELFAVHRYTERSAEVNLFLQKVLDGDILEQHVKKIDLNKLSEIVDDRYNQAVLIQNYIKKHSLAKETTVFRFEKSYTDSFYKNGEVYTSRRFMSTTKENVRLNDSGINLTSKKTYPIEVKMVLKRSGADIIDISKYPTQGEVLVPVGTKFNVIREDVKVDGLPITKVTLTEI